MADLKKVRVQLLNSETNEVVEEVDVLTSADAVTLSDGETFQHKLDAGKLKGQTGNTGATGATGAKGADGATWYSGTGVTGTSTTGTVFSGSGVSAAKVNDLYLNSSTGAVYKCTTAGAASAAKWAYLCSIKGPKGDTGAQGIQGIQGPAGAKGATGGTGPQGPKGADGDKIKVGTTLSAATEYKLFFKVQ